MEPWQPEMDSELIVRSSLLPPDAACFALRLMQEAAVWERRMLQAVASIRMLTKQTQTPFDKTDLAETFRWKSLNDAMRDVKKYRDHWLEGRDKLEQALQEAYTRKPPVDDPSIAAFQV